MSNHSSSNHSSPDSVTASPGCIAPLWRRLAAMVYDALVVCAITMAYGFAAVGLKYGLLGTSLEEGEKAQLPVMAIFGLLATIGVFYCFFWHRAGQTVGMRAWRLRVENTAGYNLSWPQAIIRFVTANVSFWLAGFGYWWQLFDKTGTLHDKLSKSRVVVLEKQKK